MSYDNVYRVFYAKAVSFEIAENVYVGGVVEAVDTDNPSILLIIDQDGKEHEVDMRSRDVILL